MILLLLGEEEADILAGELFVDLAQSVNLVGIELVLEVTAEVRRNGDFQSFTNTFRSLDPSVLTRVRLPVISVG